MSCILSTDEPFDKPIEFDWTENDKLDIVSKTRNMTISLGRPKVYMSNIHNI